MSKWGTTCDERRYASVRDWIIRTRKFVCDDGTYFFQVKFAKTEWSFENPTASIFGWRSSPPRKRKEFKTHKEAYEWAVTEIENIHQ